MSLPATSTLPADGLSSAPSKDSSVLLPLPLLPMIEANFPSGTLKLTSWTASTVPLAPEKFFERLETFNIIASLFGPHYVRRADFTNQKRWYGAAHNGDD